ncbi:hypothetical protein JJC03_02370 [Flavobacterium oreochromis]|nr:hypothetical protein [Flavobacterium oreochromis]QYS86878.1 hypothetical protein JJC03_02370 [Flavobacterium oreochromis]
MNRFGDTSKISITSAADSKEYFLFDDAEVMHIPVGGKSDVYFLSKARKFVFSNPEENQLLNELKKILIFGTGNHGTSVRLDIAKDLSSIVLSADTSITFTKL